MNSSIYNVPYINFLDADELWKEVSVFVLFILNKVDTQYVTVIKWNYTNPNSKQCEIKQIVSSTRDYVFSANIEHEH